MKVCKVEWQFAAYCLGQPKFSLVLWIYPQYLYFYDNSNSSSNNSDNSYLKAFSEEGMS